MKESNLKIGLAIVISIISWAIIFGVIGFFDCTKDWAVLGSIFVAIPVGNYVARLFTGIDIQKTIFK